MVMPPLYEFKCPECKKNTEVTIGFSQFNCKDNTILGECSNKKCKTALHREDQQINFQGVVTMAGASAMGITQKLYSNKAGGPVGLSSGKPVGRAKI
jgi:hypothetical protein